jgi:hypothetical protein
MKRAEIGDAMTRATVTSAELALRRESALTLYNAAAFVGNATECDGQRQHLHALLDAHLDNSGNLMALQRMLVEAKE